MAAPKKTNRIKEILNDIQKYKDAINELEICMKEELYSEEASDKRSGSEMKGNKGDWSEIYVFYKLMAEGKLTSAKVIDGKLEKDRNTFLPVLKILREDKKGVPIEYYTANDRNGEKAFQICFSGHEVPLAEKTKKEFEEQADDLYKKIRAGKGRSFQFPDHKKFLNDIFITKIKSPSKKVTDLYGGIGDITLEIIREDNMSAPAAFSIKSSLGSAATLFNTSNANIVTYRLDGCTDTIMNHVNKQINTRQKVIDRVRYILAEEAKGAITVKLENMGNDDKNKTFENNLVLISDREPELLARALLYAHLEAAGKQIADRVIYNITRRLIQNDPLHIGDNKERYYKKKLKDLLFERACGMTSDDPWDGDKKISGGYIFVDNKGEIYLFFARDQDVFMDWLFKNTRFETPSTGRHGIAEIKKKEDKYYFKLGIDIRFLDN